MAKFRSLIGVAAIAALLIPVGAFATEQTQTWEANTRWEQTPQWESSARWENTAQWEQAATWENTPTWEANAVWESTRWENTAQWEQNAQWESVARWESTWWEGDRQVSEQVLPTTVNSLYAQGLVSFHAE